jgi:hypothetical protein
MQGVRVRRPYSHENLLPKRSGRRDRLYLGDSCVLGIVAVGLTFFTMAMRVAPLFHVFTGAFASALGLVSITCGLLGWLLVRKKHVLQCSVCGSIVRLP